MNVNLYGIDEVEVRLGGGVIPGGIEVGEPDGLGGAYWLDLEDWCALLTGYFSGSRFEGLEELVVAILDRAGDVWGEIAVEHQQGGLGPCADAEDG